MIFGLFTSRYRPLLSYLGLLGRSVEHVDWIDEANPDLGSDTACIRPTNHGEDRVKCERPELVAREERSVKLTWLTRGCCTWQPRKACIPWS